jgi:hypothetical protein
MRAASSPEQAPDARAWFLCEEFDVVEHARLVDSDTNQIFPEYIRKLIDSRISYLDSRLQGMNFISYSVPRTLSSLQNPGAVPMDAIFHGSQSVPQLTENGRAS